MENDNKSVKTLAKEVGLPPTVIQKMHLSLFFQALNELPVMGITGNLVIYNNLSAYLSALYLNVNA